MPSSHINLKWSLISSLSILHTNFHGDSDCLYRFPLVNHSQPSRGCKAQDVILGWNSICRPINAVGGIYRFTAQNDYNLVLYHGNWAIWATGTNGRGTNCNCRMQRDGDLVVYTGTGSPVWASNTNIGRKIQYYSHLNNRNF